MEPHGFLELEMFENLFSVDGVRYECLKQINILLGINMWRYTTIKQIRISQGPNNSFILKLDKINIQIVFSITSFIYNI